MKTKRIMFAVIFTMTLLIAVGEVRGGPEPYLIWWWTPPYNGGENGTADGYVVGKDTGNCYKCKANIDESGQGEVYAVALPEKKCTAVVRVRTGRWQYNATNTGGAVQSHFYLSDGEVARFPLNTGAHAYVKIVLNEWYPNNEWCEQYKRKVWYCDYGPIMNVDKTRYISGFTWKKDYKYEAHVYVVAHSTFGHLVESGSAVGIDDVKIHSVEWWGGVEDCGNNMDSDAYITLSHPFCYVGTLITVDGTRFSSSKPVTITFDSMEVATTATDGSGDFTITFYVPDVLGLSVVRAEDADGNFAEEPLSVESGIWPPPAVGGFWVPVDKFGLLAPYIGLASTILVATVATAIYVKRVKRRKEKQ